MVDYTGLMTSDPSMAEARCRTCMYWARMEGEDGLGRCLVDGPLATAPVTSEDFGCSMYVGRMRI